MAEMNSNTDISREDFDLLLEWIISSAKSVAETYQKDKADPFNQGLAQAYTEVFDYLDAWADAQGYEIDFDFEGFTVEQLG